jgi:hypothetical protein
MKLKSTVLVLLWFNLPMVLNSDVVKAQTSNNNSCGFKPMPNVGCDIGKCIDGQWKQNCISDEYECGIKPIPNLGCEVGERIGQTIAIFEPIQIYQPPPF